MVTRFLLCIACAALAACGVKPQTVNELIIQNRTSEVVYEVKLKIPETGKIVSCSSILSGSECSLGFPERALQGNLANLSWLEDGVGYNRTLSAGNIAAVSDRPLHAVVVILPGGHLQAGLE